MQTTADRSPRPRARHFIPLLVALAAGAVSLEAPAADFFLLSPTLAGAPCPSDRSFASMQSAIDAVRRSPDAFNRIHLFSDAYPAASFRASIAEAGRLEIVTDLATDCSIEPGSTRRASFEGDGHQGSPLISITGSEVTMRRINLTGASEAFIDLVDGELELHDVDIRDNHREIVAQTGTPSGGVIVVRAGAASGTRLRAVGGMWNDNSSAASGGVLLCDGGIDADHEASITLEGVNAFRNEAAGDGGVVHLVQNCSLDIGFGPGDRRPRLEDNIAGGRGGVVGTPAGGTLLRRSVAVEGADLRRNLAELGGAIGLADGDALLVAQSSFERNTADEGGAILALGVEQVSVFASRFVENRAGLRGGAISMRSRIGEAGRASSLLVSGGCDSRALAANSYCMHFDGNRAEAFGDEDPQLVRTGGALDVVGARVTLDRVAFSHNAAGSGPSLAWVGESADGPVDRLVELRQVLFEFNDANREAPSELELFSPTDAFVRADQVTLADFGLDFARERGIGNFDFDVTRSILPPSDAAVFGDCNLSERDARFDATHPRGRWRLQPGSPAIDPPRPGCVPQRRFVDLDGNERDSLEDWGAFEFALPPQPRPDPIFASDFEAFPPG